MSQNDNGQCNNRVDEKSVQASLKKWVFHHWYTMRCETLPQVWYIKLLTIYGSNNTNTRALSNKHLESATKAN